MKVIGNSPAREEERGGILAPVDKFSTPPSFEEGLFRVRFARDRADLERLLRLRFEVFNLELGEGLAESYATGMDEDRFDATCHHVLIEEIASGALVGTYRMQTSEMAGAGSGWYCAGEFDLSTLPPDVLGSSVELGRACVVEAHRQGGALFALWRGLAAYMQWTGKRYFFGCCSLTSQDPMEGRRLHRWLLREGHVHPTVRVHALSAHSCGMAMPQELSTDPGEVKVPKLFGTYLRYGVKVCGEPAIDRAFKTIDWLVLFDLELTGRRVRQLFFAGFPRREDAVGS